MTITTTHILHSYGYVELPKLDNVAPPVAAKDTVALVGTLMSNLAYYGYVPSKEIVEFLYKCDSSTLTTFWRKLELVLKDNSGAGRDIGKYVVYKNFPKEVLEMSVAEYWINQILMYIGLPNELFTQEEVARDSLFEKVSLKVLHVAAENSIFDIYSQLLSMKNRWSDEQQAHAFFITDKFSKDYALTIDLDTIGFKENGVRAIINAHANLSKVKFVVSNTTDVLRLAAGMSGADVSLREEVKFAKFKRPQRRLLLDLIEQCKNIEDDFATRPDTWKKFLMVAHPGDYRTHYPRVIKAYDALYRSELKSFAAKVDPSVLQKNDLGLLASRPGEFLRRFHATYALFGKDAVDAFIPVIPKLSTLQLLKFRKYLETINGRKFLTVAPRGNWTRLQILPNKKTAIRVEDAAALISEIYAEIRTRMAKFIPDGVALDESTKYVKLQTNDQSLASYGRGTVFPIPSGIKFIRAASYWGKANDFRNSCNTWMDNGFNFFDKKWGQMGSICWNHAHYHSAAAFSGDPTNSKTPDGKACQVIDLYLDKLLAVGVRYAVWNILSYNNIPFDDVDDVFASLQWGEDAFSGELYEPSRAQMEFPIKGANKTKYIAVIDVKERQLIYIDANLRGDVASASQNSAKLEPVMPAFMEYLNSLPSVYDLFRNTTNGSVPITYSDATLDIKSGSAYVFRKENPDNVFTQLDLTALLS